MRHWMHGLIRDGEQTRIARPRWPHAHASAASARHGGRGNPNATTSSSRGQLPADRGNHAGDLRRNPSPTSCSARGKPNATIEAAPGKRPAVRKRRDRPRSKSSATLATPNISALPSRPAPSPWIPHAFSRRFVVLATSRRDRFVVLATSNGKQFAVLATSKTVEQQKLVLLPTSPKTTARACRRAQALYAVILNCGLYRLKGGVHVTRRTAA
jgi:hypothetical protein